MYISPIQSYVNDIKFNYDGEVLKAVQSVGINVDKIELLKALEYDRGQYEKGYKDGYKAKEFDRQGDCDGCKFVGVFTRCEGCCRNYADGYIAEQADLQTDCGWKKPE